MKKLIIYLLVLGITIQAYSQEDTVTLPEIKISGVNYKYLSDVGASEAALPVKVLQHRAASFDLKNADFYKDENRGYDVYFEIPQGKILAIYNKEGEIVRTSERFKDIHLPLAVSNAIVDKYPGWTIKGDIYLVNYKKTKGAKKMYKLLLEKDGKYNRVKTDHMGNFI